MGPPPTGEFTHLPLLGLRERERGAQLSSFIEVNHGQRIITGANHIYEVGIQESKERKKLDREGKRVKQIQ